MKVDDELVRKVARLARIELTDEEITSYGKQLAKVLGHIEQLKEVDVEGVDPLTHAGDFVDVFREDKERPSLSPEEALGNAPERKDGFFVVPKVIEE